MPEEFDLDLRSTQEARNLVKRCAEAQKVFARFNQYQVDTVVAAMAEAGFRAAERLGQMANEETKLGVPIHASIAGTVRAVEADAVVVAAAGNYGPAPGSVSSPASAEKVEAAGAFALMENGLYTVEAFRAMLSVLVPGVTEVAVAGVGDGACCGAKSEPAA